jgi:hypothetical protein
MASRLNAIPLYDMRLILSTLKSAIHTRFGTASHACSGLYPSSPLTPFSPICPEKEMTYSGLSWSRSMGLICDPWYPQRNTRYSEIPPIKTLTR